MRRGERLSGVDLCSVVMSYTAYTNRSRQNFRVGELSAQYHAVIRPTIKLKEIKAVSLSWDDTPHTKHTAGQLTK